MLLALLWVLGCGEPAEPVASPAPGAQDAALCPDHGVLQELCPKCNPRLAAVFQAKGDWCHDHGFPASFCPTCRPEQGGRPLVEVSPTDDAPADGTLVRFKTRETARLAGIELAEAQEAAWTGGTTAVARIAWDATRVALVSARSPGIVVDIRADAGTPVTAGTPLAVLRSASVGGDRSRIAAARQLVTVLEGELDRKQQLLEAGITSQREVRAAEQAVASARAELGALSAELGLVGSGSGDTYTLTAPRAGVVTARHAAVGLSVHGDTPLFEIVDASRMWAELDIAEADLAVVRPGQPVTVTLDALPDRLWHGEIAWIAPFVDPRTRTAQARVVLDNPDGALRAHMYGAAHVVTEHTDAVVVVPSAAVQRAGEAHLVFVRQAPDTYVARRVRVLARQGDQVRVLGAVAAGDPVVTTGSFLLKTETLKDSIGAGCCDVE